MDGGGECCDVLLPGALFLSSVILYRVFGISWSLWFHVVSLGMCPLEYLTWLRGIARNTNAAQHLYYTAMSLVASTSHSIEQRQNEPRLACG